MKRVTCSTILFVLSFFVLNSFLGAKNISDLSSRKLPQKKSNQELPYTLSNINNWSYWLQYDGRSGVNPYNANAGGIYPRGFANTIYQDGLVWGAWINDEVRVGGQTYRTGTQPLVQRIYRIRSDWATLTPSDVRQEAAEHFNVPIESVTEAMEQDIIDQYRLDWKNLPGDQGAPYVDLNNNGIYDPILEANGMPDPSQGDYPGIHQADQVIWFKVNDQDASLTNNLYGSNPMGVELEVTVWAFKQTSSALGQTIFKKYKITNISDDTFEEMYLAQWSDPDLGYYTDDLVGCDPELNSMFAYNSSYSDEEFEKFGLIPPAVGYVLLQGPVVPSPGDTAYVDSLPLPDYKNLPMTSFGYMAAGGMPNDPTMGDYKGTLQWYNLMRGFMPTTSLDYPEPYEHRDGPYVGQATKFPLDGDPVIGSGDLDGRGTNSPPGDRRMVLVSGPFTLAPGESQEMVVALVGGYEENYLYSISNLKSNIRTVQEVFKAHFHSESIKTVHVSYQTSYPDHSTTELSLKADLTDFAQADSCVATLKPQIGSAKPIAVPLYDDGQHDDEQAGDHIWGNRVSVANRKYPHTADVTIYQESEQIVFPNHLVNMQLRPAPVLENWRLVWENRKLDGHINNDETVHLRFDIHNVDAVNKIDSITIYSKREFIHSEAIAPGETFGVDPYFFVVNGPGTGDSVTLNYWVVFDKSFISVNVTFPVVYLEGEVKTVDVTHQGPSDASLSISIVDEDALTGDEYKVFFTDKQYYRDQDGEWKEVGQPDSTGQSLFKAADVSPSRLSAAAIFSEQPGTVDVIFTLDLQSPNHDWVDGIKIDFPDDLKINNWSAPDGSYGQYASNGQNVSNSDGTLDETTNTILWGDSSRSAFGGFQGTVYLKVNVDKFTPPKTFKYTIYDDGYSGTIADAHSSVTVEEIGYEFKTERHWNVMDVTTDQMVLEDLTVIDGRDVYTGEIAEDPIADGLLLTLHGSYEAPKSFSDVILRRKDGSVISIADFNITATGIGDYSIYGWAEDARAVTTRGFGSTDPGELGDDYEIRWTGVYKSEPTIINGIKVWEVASGGSMATLYGCRLASLADHPLNPNPGQEKPFLVRIPFEVWNKDTGEQINISIYDRKQVYDGSMEIYAFNPQDRMYTEFVNTPYDSLDAIPEDGGEHRDHFTWNLVWWESNFEQGDIIEVQYIGAITLDDYFLFTAEPSAIVKNDRVVKDFRLAQNYPNPFNPMTTIEYQIPVLSKVELTIYNILGQKVRTLVNKKQPAGSYRLQFNASNLASGVYVYRLKAGSYVSSKKMLVIK